jgi:hypothetical protein
MNSTSQAEVDRLDESGLAGIIAADENIDSWTEFKIELAEQAVITNRNFPNHNASPLAQWPALVFSPTKSKAGSTYNWHESLRRTIELHGLPITEARFH